MAHGEVWRGFAVHRTGHDAAVDRALAAVEQRMGGARAVAVDTVLGSAAVAAVEDIVHVCRTARHTDTLRMSTAS